MEVKQVLEERGQTHGEYDHVALTAQYIKEGLAGGYAVHTLCSYQRESLDMIASKLARVVNGDPNEIDHWRDIAGYAQLVIQYLERDTA